MAKIYNQIQVDVAKKNNYSAISSKQLDVNSRFLKIELTENGSHYDYDTTNEIIFVANKNDESKAYSCTIDDKYIIAPLSSWVLADEGFVDCEIILVDIISNTKLSSFLFSIDVEKNIYNDEDITSDENYDLLVKLIADVKGSQITSITETVEDLTHTYTVTFGDESVKTFTIKDGKDADISNFYTKTEIDDLLTGKQNKLVNSTGVNITNSGKTSSIELDYGNYLEPTQKPISAEVMNTFMVGEFQPVVDALLEKADIDSVYDKSETYSQNEVDSLLTSKASTSDLSTLETKVDLKADSSSVYKKVETYSQSEIDSKLSNKMDNGSSYTKTETDTELAKKQDTLVSGTNIKTINSTSILGEGDIEIKGGGISATEVTLGETYRKYVKPTDIFTESGLYHCTDGGFIGRNATAKGYIEVPSDTYFMVDVEEDGSGWFVAYSNSYIYQIDDWSDANEDWRYDNLIQQKVLDDYSTTEDMETYCDGLIDDTTSTAETTYSSSKIETLVPTITQGYNHYIGTYATFMYGLPIKSDYQIEITFNVDTYQNNGAIFGNSAGARYMHLTMYDNKWYTSSGSYETNFTGETTGKHTFIMNKNNGNYFDGNKVTDYEPYDRAGTYLWIGGRNDAVNSVCDIYEFKVTSNSTSEVLFDFIPTKISINGTVICGYSDSISGAFISSSGEFTFKEDSE